MDRGSVIYAAMVSCAGAALAGALAFSGPKSPRPPAGGSPTDATTATFVNWETGQVHPVDMTPDGSKLLVCNTADNRLEVFDLTGPAPLLVAEIPVGLDPISVRARGNGHAWVVNNISDSLSVVDLNARSVINTLKTRDEPSDVVFAGTPDWAFVSCSQANTVQVFDPRNLAIAPIDIAINGEDPRALAVSPDGSKVYAAIFNSGNATTSLGGSGTNQLPGVSFPPNVVSDGDGPYGGVNPPPNSGAAFSPPLAGGIGAPPRSALIVRKDAAGHWMDDNSHDWTSKVSGPQAPDSGRPVGWDMPDRDVAVIATSSLAVSYATGLMNICAGIAVNPATGRVAVVGMDATNEVRFEPNVKGRFVHVELALVDPITMAKTVKDLNPHLVPYTAQQLPQSERDKSIGDPRGIVWNAAGTRAYIAGLGSNNIIVIDAAGDRAGLAQTIPVGEGPTGVAMDDARSRIYVLNRFAASISVIDAGTETVVATVPFYDPTPTPIKVGRKHLYDTHRTSGLGQASCASCHIDARMDRLGWDLGDPSGAVKALTGQNLGAGINGLSVGTSNPAFAPWHPMKGVMVTQTLQDIIGKEPLHWRGDRAGIEEFNGAFVSLLGDDVQLTTQEMQEFEDFLATIVFPPNPFRNFDNTLPTILDTKQTTPARFGPPGLPLPLGRPNTGLTRFRDTSASGRLDTGAFACATCHTTPTGTGPDGAFSGSVFQSLPAGPNGERHHQLVTFDNSENITIKTPQLRNAYAKLGFDCNSLESNAGFGFFHDGTVDTIARFVSEPVFFPSGNQDIADLTALIMCWSGSDLPAGSNSNPLLGPGTPSKDVPASVGAQTTVLNGASVPPAQSTLITSMIAQAQANKVGVVVKGVVAGQQRGYVYRSASSQFQPDRAGQANLSPAALLALAVPGGELTYTVVPKVTETRIGIDRDEDGVLDRDQLDLACYANCDGGHTPPILNVNDFGCFLNRFAAGEAWANCDASTTPPVLNVLDFSCFLNKFAAGCP